ncbi:MAG TPA: PAS domain-containing sensor histidine kinase [Gemmatimonadaceae bacterium]|nr:PAS domain-containing sensor histidine kinase [Gemmatimonadaceae bacterium]
MTRQPDKAAGRKHSTSASDAPALQTPLAEALKQGGHLYQLMIDSVNDYAIFMLDATGHIASWNRGAERIKGYTADEIIGSHFSRFYTREDLASEKPRRELEIAVREGKYEEEGIRLRKDGSQFWANVVITPVKDENNALIGFTKVTRDLTERRAAQERALQDARHIAEVEASNAAKSEFLTAMSHELRTPLNAIGGYTELLSLGLGGPITPEQVQYLERIRRSQQHLMGIITDLLNFSRIEAGQLSYSLSTIALNKILNTVIPMVEPQAIGKGVHLSRGPCSPDWTAFADSAKVDQILLNLLSNAIKFTAPGGRVVVDCSVDGKEATIKVADTGVGIPLEKQEAIFEPFVQLGRSLSSAHEGTGLGLAISRDLARAMNGDLRVESSVGTGSTFTLLLPRGEETSEPVKAT